MFHEAEILCREALEKEEKVFDMDHPLTKFTQEILAKALEGAGKKY